MSTFGTLYYILLGTTRIYDKSGLLVFLPSLPSLEARNDTKPSHESSLVRAGGSKPAIQLLYHFSKTFIISSVNLLMFFNIVSLLNI